MVIVIIVVLSWSLCQVCMVVLVMPAQLLWLWMWLLPCQQHATCSGSRPTHPPPVHLPALPVVQGGWTVSSTNGHVKGLSWGKAWCQESSRPRHWQRFCSAMIAFVSSRWARALSISSSVTLKSPSIMSGQCSPLACLLVSINSQKLVCLDLAFGAFTFISRISPLLCHSNFIARALQKE